MKSKLSYRKACYDDMQLIYEWANDPMVRAGSFNSKMITPEEHKNWFTALLQDESRILYIISDEKDPVGQLRFSFEGNKAEISYSVSPSKRGRGYGKRIIEMAAELVRDNHQSIDALVAKVKKGNRASDKCFVENGYTVTEEDDSFTGYEYTLRKQDE